MVEHLQHTAFHPLPVERKNTEGDEPQMTDTGIRHQRLEVALRHRDPRTVNNAARRRGADPQSPVRHHFRKQRHTEPDQTVRSGFGHGAGQQNQGGNGAGHIGVRQPAVKRENGNFDRERQEKENKHVKLNIRRHLRVQERGNIESQRLGQIVMHNGHPDNAHQHQQTAHQRVDHKLGGGVNPVALSPEPDKEISGDQHQLPEHVKQNGIERHKHAERPRFQHQQEAQKVFQFDLVLGEKYRQNP